MKITEEMKRKARQADIVQFCQEMGETLYCESESKGEYRIKDCDGLLIMENFYYWWGSPTGDGKLEGQPPNTSNNTLSFAMYYYGMSFRQAVMRLTESKYSLSKSQAQAIYQKAQAKPIISPAKAPNNAEIIQYLTTQRALDKAIVLEMIELGLLYQEAEHNNCVFVCKNPLNNEITGYEIKGILKTKFQRNAGSGLFSFAIGEPLDMWIFESAIDLLSLYEMGKKAGNLENVLLVSMGGISKAEKVRQIALNLKAKNQNSTVHLAVDNDKAGINFCENFKNQNPDLTIVEHIPRAYKGTDFKDWNERLVFQKFN